MKVSIIIPTYNRPALLHKALQSAVEQSYENKEIIVIDDGSRGMVRNVVKEYPGVIYHKKQNGGISSAMNKGIEMSTGDVIVPLHDDDMFYDKHSLKKRIEPLKDFDVVWTDGIDVNKAGETIKAFESGCPSQERIWKEDYIYMPSMAWKKSIHNKIGMFSKDLISNEDWEFKIKCVMECLCFYLNRKTIKYRRHDGDTGNKSTKNASKMDMYKNLFMERLHERYK